MLTVGKIIYFDVPGSMNTEKTLWAARERAAELGVTHAVVASTTGETALKACDILEGFNIVIVRHHTGFSKPGFQEMGREYEEEILSKGAKILTATHAFSGVERALKKKLGLIGPVELIAETLRLFGEGMKVCVEIAVMAADAGLIPVDSDVVSIAGTSRGADTAIILKPANSSNFFNIEIKEIIAKPRTR